VIGKEGRKEDMVAVKGGSKDEGRYIIFSQ
jgi:hypothetical protein